MEAEEDEWKDEEGTNTGRTAPIRWEGDDIVAGAEKSGLDE